jgi:2Fe-2S ferredoxin
MSTITFILKDGSRRMVDIDDHPNAMQEAQVNNIPGIEAACGGFCSCATCHVYVESAEHLKGPRALPPPAPDEAAMLGGTAAQRDKKTSRLSCQILLSPALDGLVLRIPDRQ